MKTLYLLFLVISFFASCSESNVNYEQIGQIEKAIDACSEIQDYDEKIKVLFKIRISIDSLRNILISEEKGNNLTELQKKNALGDLWIRSGNLIAETRKKKIAE